MMNMGVESDTNYLTKGGFRAGNIGILTRLVKSQMEQVHLLSNRAEQEVVCLGEGRGRDLGGDYENRETGDCLKCKQCNFFIQRAEVKIVLN